MRLISITSRIVYVKPPPSSVVKAETKEVDERESKEEFDAEEKHISRNKLLRRLI
jgi:hypothetical protein